MNNWITPELNEQTGKWEYTLDVDGELKKFSYDSKQEANHNLKEFYIKQLSTLDDEKPKKKKKSVIYEEEVDSLREALEETLVMNDLEEPVTDDNRMPQAYSIDLAKVKEGAKEKAKKTMDTLLKFYVDESVIDKEEYIRWRVEINKMEFASLLFAMETCENAICILLSTIHAGEQDSRRFEVLGNLQKSLLDVIKSQTTYLMAAEDNFKKLARDFEIYKPDSVERKEISEGGNGKGIAYSSRGSKGIIDVISEAVKKSKEDGPVENKSDFNGRETRMKLNELDDEAGAQDENDYDETIDY